MDRRRGIARNSAGSDREAGSKRDLSRRRHLLRLWQDLAAIEPFPQLDRWLARRMRRERSFGKRDRRWYTEALFTLVRFAYPALLLAFVRKQPTPPADDTAWQERLDQLANVLKEPAAFRSALFHADFDCIYAFADARARTETGSEAAAGLSAADSALLASFASAASRGTHPKLRLAWHGLAPWVAPLLTRRAARSGWDGTVHDTFLAMQSRRPPAWLRLSDLTAAQRLSSALAARGADAAPAGMAVRVTDPPNVRELEQLAGGPVEMQDLASQGIANRVTPRPGESVWDCCAGAGGKALQIAARHPSARLYASDTRGYKLGELSRRATRAGAPPITTLRWDAARQTRPPFAPSEGFDWVLVDAPCSGSGTWRRNPDGRLRWALSDLEELTALQRRLLRSALAAVKPGGHVVYATCSWFVEENEDVVERVLDTFHSASLRESALLGCPAADADTAYAAVMALGDRVSDQFLRMPPRGTR